MNGLAKLVGLPYGNKGRGPDAFDCYGLFLHAQRTLFGRETPAYDDYIHSDHFKSVSASIDVHKLSWYKVEYADRKAGDAIVLSLRAMPVHVGLIIDENKMLHTLPGKNSCIERYTGSQWNRRIEGIYRWLD